MTKAIILQDLHQESFKKDDRVTIDGYVRGAGGRPYAVAIRESDGIMGLVSIYQIRAIRGSC